MDDLRNITVDKTYFDALLRRANFHSQMTGNMAHPGPGEVIVSTLEYQSLLLVNCQFNHLKKVLLEGGVSAETLDLLIANTDTSNVKTPRSNTASTFGSDVVESCMQSKNRTWGNPKPAYGPRSMPENSIRSASEPLVKQERRRDSYRATSSPAEEFVEDSDQESSGDMQNDINVPSDEIKHTLYFSCLPQQTTYRDLLSVIKGAKVVSVILNPDNTACVTLSENAAEYLVWAKRSKVEVHGLRVEVKWAYRQYRVHDHIRRRIASGSTRNIIVHSAIEKGITEQQIRDDLDHIHNLAIVDIKFRDGAAFVSINSIHNALFARTCMLSRTAYKGCKIEFIADECDVPFPTIHEPRAVSAESIQKSKHKASVPSNRFNLLSLDGDGDSEDEDDDDGDDDSRSTLDLCDSDNEIFPLRRKVDDDTVLS